MEAELLRTMETRKPGIKTTQITPVPYAAHDVAVWCVAQSYIWLHVGILWYNRRVQTEIIDVNQALPIREIAAATKRCQKAAC